ncbi:MAG: DUF1573 domain-containing protein [Bacteroidales bacterium]|nr:DUF1573 domain-containing protein [Bacteroidales bacterium]
MKNTLIITIIALLFGNSVLAQNTKKGEIINFLKTEYNFGTLKQNDTAGCWFVFQNTGNEPLVLASVGTTCGCTVPQWSRKPVLPGKCGRVRVRYNTAQKGAFRKVVSVKSNATNQNPCILWIKGKVE